MPEISELTTRLRELHTLDPRRSARTLSQRCLTCFEEWPCETATLLDRIEELEGKLSKAQEANHHYAGLTFADGGNP